MHNLEIQGTIQGNDARWGELVERLQQRVDALVDVFMARLAEIPEYAEGRVGLPELRATARETFSRLVDGLRTPENGLVSAPELARAGAAARNPAGRGVLAGTLAQFSSDLGARRARAGVSSDALASAVRLDFTVLWADLLEISEPGDAAVLTSRVDQVWRVVDAFATQTHASYAAERARMAQEESNVRREFIARLFSKSTLSADTVSQAGSALSTDTDAMFSIVAASGDAASRLRAIAVQSGWNQPQQRLFMHEFGGSTYVFWPLPRAAGTNASTLGRDYIPAAIKAVPCGYVPGFSGLRGLPPAARTAERLALLLQPDDRGPLTAGAAWARLAKQQLQDAGLDLWADLDEALSACRGGERERLEETVRHFLLTGNITTTAQELFCHRNTILNRLNRFEEITGLDLTVPAQAARLVVAWA